MFAAVKSKRVGEEVDSHRAVHDEFTPQNTLMQPERDDHGKRGLPGFDGGKLVKGRTRHLLVDIEGLVLNAVVGGADVLDRDGDELVGWAVKRFGLRLPCLVKIWVEGAYKHLAEWMRAVMGWELEVVRRPEGQKGFVVQKQRCKVERTFAWLGRFRRLSKDT